MQKCYRCGELKSAEEFAWRRKWRNQRDSYCRPCRSAYKREHYRNNKQRYIDQAEASKRRLRLERTHYLIDYFAAHPCADCGEADPLVLEFDHLGDKLFNVSEAFVNRRWEAIIEEIAKCDVVCVNCHRRRTARRRGSWRAVLTGLGTEEGSQP